MKETEVMQQRGPWIVSTIRKNIRNVVKIYNLILNIEDPPSVDVSLTDSLRYCRIGDKNQHDAQCDSCTQPFLENKRR